MVDGGLTLAVEPAGSPLSQVTEPEQFVTVKVVLSPAQIVGLFTAGVGFGLTVTVETTVPTQPAAVVQVAV